MSWRVEGRAFHVSGPEENARSPIDVRHLGSRYNVLSAEYRPGRVGLSAMAETVSARYAGHIPWWTECIMVHSLCWMRWCTGSQYSWRMAGVAWSRARSPSMRRAAAFCTRCRGAVVDLGRHAKTEWDYLIINKAKTKELVFRRPHHLIKFDMPDHLVALLRGVLLSFSA